MNKYLVTLAAVLMSGMAHAATVIDVHRDANCGCCKDWIKYLQANGFEVRDHVESNMPAVKQSLGVVPRLGSCHTGVIDGKFVEGHVPVAAIRELQQRDDLLASPHRACPPARLAWIMARPSSVTRSSA